jgi:hypothetical protein
VLMLVDIVFYLVAHEFHLRDQVRHVLMQLNTPLFLIRHGLAMEDAKFHSLHD